MARVRSRRAPDRRVEWPLSVRAELVKGVDLDQYTDRLARFFALWASNFAAEGKWTAAVEELQTARDNEEIHRSGRPAWEHPSWHAGARQ